MPKGLCRLDADKTPRTPRLTALAAPYLLHAPRPSRDADTRRSTTSRALPQSPSLNDDANGSAINIDRELRSDIRRYSSRAIALSSALSALPNQSEDSGYNCGVGMGNRGRFSAMSIGHATDFSNFSFFGKMPALLKNASLNAGSSFLIHDDADSTSKVGLSLKFGKSKSTSNVSSRDRDVRYKLNVAEQEKRSVKKKDKRLKELVEESKHLQAQIDEIKGQLMTMNEIKMQLAALTEARVASN